MSDSTFDAVIVGGGLSGGLAALALYKARPDFRLAVIEAGKTLGGNHRWSWFDSDLDDRGRALLEPIRKTAWTKGYDVSFPNLKRTLHTGYTSMASGDFHEGICRVLPSEALLLGRKATDIKASGVTLDDGTRLNARLVIDCRNFQPSPHLRGGWQVFMGRHMRLNEPHGAEHPVIMDADVEQLAPHGNGGAYRFVYVLPLSERDVFVEDTYYADDPKLDRTALEGRIDQYCHDKGWMEGVPVAHETGVLPVLTGGDFDAYQREVRLPGVVAIGARAGFIHPLTSYTMPIAMENALALADKADLPAAQVVALFEARARRHWNNTAYYRLLTRFLFFAADPERRYVVLQRFYGLGQGLIERFYAARSPLRDRARVLWGKPPVSIPRAIKAMFQPGKPLRKPRNSDSPAASSTENTA
ncbi:MAG: lycopene beta-cyclase CrtY [Erythrobacter sp.]|uniref:lycopene beta-cyclase CrtY n=1 Tax=Erythrobacter sp. TaxID=1042 RepID=UPI002618B677|nr:lycopene beta-cyclase CrtY [Erythrobacter sp.]MDJ0979804.1 lycopene beta-cyclase CrtY [Erythrobacter sp.]